MKLRILLTILTITFCTFLMGCSGGTPIAASVGIKDFSITENGVEKMTIKVIIDDTEVEIDLSDIINEQLERYGQGNYGFTHDQMRDFITDWWIYKTYPSILPVGYNYIACDAPIDINGFYLGDIGLRGALGLIQDNVIYVWFNDILESEGNGNPIIVTPPC